MLTKITNVIHVRHLLYILPFILFALLVIYTARLLKYYLPRKTNGFNVILILSTFLSWFFLNDYLEIKPVITWGILFVSIAIFSIYTYSRFRPEVNLDSLKTGTNREFIRLTVTYLIGIVLICVPLLFFIPKNVIVVADGVNSDIIQHSVFTQGYIHSRSLNIIKDEDSYPRAFHSTMYYINQFINYKPPYVVLLGLIMIYAFVVFAMDEILYYTNLKNRRIKYLLMILPLVPFLMLATLYSNFVPHIASMPFILIGLFAILNLNFKSRYLIRDVLLISAIALATFNIYSIFALNVLVVGALVKLLIELLKNRNSLRQIIKKENISKFFNENRFGNKNTLGVLTMVAIGLIPAIPLLITTYIYTKTQTGFLLTSNGNLSDYLSPWHITGIWNWTEGYRSQLSVWTSYLFTGILVVQLYFLFKAKVTNTIKLMLGILVFLNVVGVVFINNRYVEFKYLTFLIPIFGFVFGFGVVSVADSIKNKWLSRGLAVGGLLLYIVVALGLSSLQYREVPTINADGKFNTLQQLQDTYFDDASVLYIGYDDWTIYFREQNNDYFPTLGYLHNKYNNESVDYFIIDPIYIEDIDARVAKFLNDHPELKTKIEALNESCKTTFLNRYTVYDLQCQ